MISSADKIPRHWCQRYIFQKQKIRACLWLADIEKLRSLAQKCCWHEGCLGHILGILLSLWHLSPQTIITATRSYVTLSFLCIVRVTVTVDKDINFLEGEV